MIKWQHITCNMNNNLGYWITDFVSPPDICSNCHQRTQGGWIEPYCPKCGAKMLGIKSEVTKASEEKHDTNNICYDWETIEEATEM